MYQTKFTLQNLLFYICLINFSLLSNATSGSKRMLNDKNFLATTVRRGLAQTPSTSFEDLPRKGKYFLKLNQVNF